MHRLQPISIVTPRTPNTIGEPGARTETAHGWSRFAGRKLTVKAILRDHADRSVSKPAQVVAQPWHGCENSAPDDLPSQNPCQRINEVGLISASPDRRLTGERAAEGWATGPNLIGSAAVASGDAKFSPRVRVQQFQSCRASQMREAEERNLLP
jgi:hypothetical protein